MGFALRHGGRRQLLGWELDNALFVTSRGSAMTRQAFWYLIKRYARQAGIAKPLSPHTLRHAFATHLLNHGADLRVVQLCSGTPIFPRRNYTHVARERLKRLHALASSERVMVPHFGSVGAEVNPALPIRRG